MSLKAKLEAVIYAAEEPVTLGQLAVLFADEALALKAEQDAAAEPQADASAVADTENLSLLGDESADETSESPGTGGPAAADIESSVPEFDAGDSVPEPAGETAAGEASLTDPSQAEADEKRAAKLRDREARGVIRGLLNELIADYSIDGRGIEIREIAGGYRMATKPECHDAVRAFVKEPEAGDEAVATGARDPGSHRLQAAGDRARGERDSWRRFVGRFRLAAGAQADCHRRPQTRVGRPILYKTTREFLLRFGLKDVPSCRRWRSSRRWRRANWRTGRRGNASRRNCRVQSGSKRRDKRRRGEWRS